MAHPKVERLRKLAFEITHRGGPGCAVPNEVDAMVGSDIREIASYLEELIDAVAADGSGTDETPACGHSACRQYWIDTGVGECVEAADGAPAGSCNECSDVCGDCTCADEEPDDMDGDHDSAMESAGFGTDEDYGYFGDE